MSLPKELLDQLLSGYLDDALTVDERVRVEQLLLSNPEVADELEQLRDLRRSLQVLSRVDSDIRLERGFADRVLGAAVARAREEGLGDDHPLIRLAEQPSTSPAVALPGDRSWRTAGVLIGLAASIAIAVFVLRPKSETGPNMIAKVDSVLSEQMATESVKPSPLVEPGPVLVGNSQVDEPRLGSAPPEAIAAVDVPAPAITEELGPAVRKPADSNKPLGTIMVLNVRRTEAGRASDVVAKAMDAADIAPASRKEITEEIAGFVAGNVGESAEDASVLYLQLSGRKFDLFHQKLWADEKGIESAQMSLAMNAPVMQLVYSALQDPITIRHEEAAYRLFLPSGLADEMANELIESPSKKVDRSKAAVATLGTGPDIQTQVLVLVH